MKSMTHSSQTTPSRQNLVPAANDMCCNYKDNYYGDQKCVKRTSGSRTGLDVFDINSLYYNFG